MAIRSSKAHIWLSAALILVTIQLSQLFSDSTLPLLYDVDDSTLPILGHADHTFAHHDHQKFHDASGPTFIFFIGPPKTGSTTLQYALKRYTDQLKEDGWHYLGIYPNFTWLDPILGTNEDPLLLERCPRTMVTYLAAKNDNSTNTKKEPPPCWAQLESYFQYHHDSGHNVILSEEGIGRLLPVSGVSRDMFQLLVNRLLANWTTVQVTVAHRYLFDHARSIINEMNQNRKAVHPMNTWTPTKNWNPGTPRNAKPITRIMTRLAKKRFAKLQLPTSQQTFQTARTLFENDTGRVDVNLLSLHSPDFLGSVFCDYLNSPTACQAYKVGGSPNRNKAPKLDYDMLAWEVYTRGWITDTINYTRIMCRKDVEDMLRFKSYNVSQLPSECTSQEEIAVLYNVSWQVEQELFGQKASLDGHKVVLEKALRDNLFCSVKAQLAIDFLSNEWEPYFRNVSSQR